MERHKSKLWNRYHIISKLALLFAPTLLGMIGFAVDGSLSPSDALYTCVCMHMLGYQSSPPNLWVELARWTAPLATAGTVVWLLTALQVRIRNGLCYLRGGSVAVYGPEKERAGLLAELGRSGIEGQTRFVNAQSYVLLDCEEKNFTFYAVNRRKLGDRDVYLKCRSLPAQFAANERLYLFYPEETAARLFWKRRHMYETSARRGHQMRIVFLGFGRLGEELLCYGLLDNIFHPEQRIAYHIFGDGSAFTAIHTQLSAVGDPVIFHKEPWYEDIALLDGAAALIVLEQEDQLRLLQNLLLASTAPKIDVFSGSAAGTELLSGQERLSLFPWKQEAQKPEHIFRGALFAQAKRLNLYYARRFSGVDDDDAEREWRKLDPFTRYSNVSEADYHSVRLEMLSAMGLPAGDKPVPFAVLDLLAELEHIRWCRYHYLHNWKYGVPEDGGNKDPLRRIHINLLPYASLPEEAREKDRESVRMLLKLDLDGGRAVTTGGEAR